MEKYNSTSKRQMKKYVAFLVVGCIIVVFFTIFIAHAKDKKAARIRANESSISQSIKMQQRQAKSSSVQEETEISQSSVEESGTVSQVDDDLSSTNSTQETNQSSMATSSRYLSASDERVVADSNRHKISLGGLAGRSYGNLVDYADATGLTIESNSHTGITATDTINWAYAEDGNLYFQTVNESQQ